MNRLLDLAERIRNNLEDSGDRALQDQESADLRDKLREYGLDLCDPRVAGGILIAAQHALAMILTAPDRTGGEVIISIAQSSAFVLQGVSV